MLAALILGRYAGGMNIKCLFTIGLLLPRIVVPAAEEEKILVALVKNEPQSGCYQLVEILDEAGKQIESAVPGQTIKIRSRFVNLTGDKFFLAERTLEPFNVQIQYFCRDFESYKNALGHDHPFAKPEAFENMKGHLHAQYYGPHFWGGPYKEWIFLHPSPQDEKLLCGCAIYGRSHHHSTAFSLDPLAWDFCVITFSRYLTVQTSDSEHSATQSGSLEFRIERRPCEPGVEIQTAWKRLKNREFIATAPGERYRITRQNMGDFSDAIEFSNPSIQTVELEPNSRPPVYSVSPDGEWVLRQAKDRNDSPILSLFRVEQNGRVSQIPAFGNLLWASSDKVTEIKRNFGDKFSMGNARWIESGKQLEVTISGKEPASSGNFTSIVVRYDVTTNLATATRKAREE